MTLLNRLHTEVSRYGLDEVADRLREIVNQQEAFQPDEYQKPLDRCLYLLEQLVNTANELKDMELK